MVFSWGPALLLLNSTYVTPARPATSSQYAADVSFERLDDAGKRQKLVKYHLGKRLGIAAAVVPRS